MILEAVIVWLVVLADTSFKLRLVKGEHGILTFKEKETGWFPVYGAYSPLLFIVFFFRQSLMGADSYKSLTVAPAREIKIKMFVPRGAEAVIDLKGRTSSSV